MKKIRALNFCALILAGLILVSCAGRSITSPVSTTHTNENTPQNILETMAGIAESETKELETSAETETIPDESEISPETEPTPELTEEERISSAISEILSRMTAEEKLGQMFLCAYEDGVSPAETADYGFSGYVLFGSDFEGETPESISAELAELQEASEFGLIFAVDEEGGSVVRVSKYPAFRTAAFASPRTVYASSGIDGLYADALEKGRLLSSIGLNMNLAPVADISADQLSFIFARSLGLTGDELNEALRAIVKGHREAGIASAVKHFPGYGSTSDTHTGMAIDTRTLVALESLDLLPFYALISDGIESVMVSHIIVTAIDETRPASVSGKIVGYIRDEMNYDGVLMTDDLAMAGITDYCTTGNAALEAVLAGFDLLCCTNWESQYPAVLEAVLNGTISDDRLDESAARVLKMKLDMGLWEFSEYTK